ncbi:hypothetical protein PISL3812_00821 [Talaromyces islandicus]|uniref:FAD-binding domain-containing protein n=1 Tax=Talaromyces islandicus TaxID=28573 RepID=A0A0U1LMD9_TALIS|nr:hypothetical protein PISL3812_00821 [Talaromyces islandicus]
MLRDILIIGSGITGLSAALSLSHHLSPLIPDLRITIFERHFVPSTSGGAIGLSPVAFRHLDYLGVLDELVRFGAEAGADVDAIEIFSARTGKSLGQVDYKGKHGTGFSADNKCHRVCGEAVQNQEQKTYKGGRVMRITLTLAMLAAIEKRGNIKIVFGKALSKATLLDPDNKIEVLFKDHSSATGDLLLGCDGVHSVTLQSTIKTDSLKTSPHFRGTSLNFSKSGSFLMTFCNKHHEDIFLSVMLECCEEAVEGHTVNDDDDEPKRSMIRDSLRREVSLRYSHSSVPCIKEVASQSDIDWMLYPIYQVPLGGKWSNEKAILLGDAAHAMLPRDESAAYAVDDAIVFSRVLARYIDHPLPKAFEVYDSIRRPKVTHAFQESSKLWKRRNKEAGVFESWIRERLVPLQIRQTESSRQAAFKSDANQVEIPPPRETLGIISGKNMSTSSSVISDTSSFRPTSKGGSSTSSGEPVAIGLVDVSGLAI